MAPLPLAILLALLPWSAFGAMKAPYYVGITFPSTTPFSFGGTPQTQFYRYPTCKRGNQSPINIEPPFTPDPNLNLRFSKSFYQVQPMLTLVNNGHFAQSVPLPKNPKRYAFFRNTTYYLCQVHYHFGETDNDGSEHQLFGLPYPLEIHLVFFNPRLGTLRHALTVQSGAFILAQFYKIGNPAPFQSTLNSMPRVALTNATFNYVPQESAADLVNLNARYFFYHGGLAAPPCPEGLDFVIMSLPKDISESQMAQFRNVLLLSDGKTRVTKAWRYVQPRNGRPIYLSDSPPSSSSSSPTQSFDSQSFENAIFG